MNLSGLNTALLEMPFSAETARRIRHVCALLAWVFAVSVDFAGCSHEGKDVLTREQMWEWIGHHVQVGMPLEAASAVMAKDGFECKAFLKASAKVIDINKKVTAGTFDFLKCVREDGSPPIKRRWEIILVHDGSKIKEIGVRSGDVYPETKGGTEKPEPQGK